ncbi:MAG TPA: mycofactocin-coupled SDR family oxidoreductase [Solirubrobacterales bacterium]|nr:mycofactocin-coupled SDR family oxidoreductase [Solirubrobacterales bacterium]
MRVAIVTGAGRGIGAATVAALAADGWRVLAVDRCGDDPRLPYAMATAAELDATVAAAAHDAAGARERVRGVAADATDAAAMAEIVGFAEEWGELEAIVANAGVIAGGAPAWELAEAEEDAIVEVCLRGVMLAARVGIPALLRRPEPRAGRFVATASTASLRGLPGLAAYCAAKAGVSGFVRALGADLRGSGITAAAVAPGSTDTAILAESARLYELEGASAFAAQQPIERLIEPAEVAALIAWLCGPGGAAVTGATLPLDGGLAI